MNECEYKKDNEKCVCVNVFVKCEKKDACVKEIWEKKDYNKDDCCVRVNVFAECNKDDWKKDDCCVEVNIFTECKKKG